MNYNEIIERAADYVRAYMQEHQNLNLFFHKLTHTENVVTATTQIVRHYELNDKDSFVCITAAWFHDIGYLKDLQNHEQTSAEMAEEFLNNSGVDGDTIHAIKECILATKVPQTPDNLLEEIVCDADLYNLGTDDFPKWNKLMRKEIEAIHHIHVNKNEWRNSTIHLLESHHYHTDYCKELLNKKKKQNLEKLKKKAEEQIATVNPMDALLHEYLQEGCHYEKEKDNEIEKPERGIETLFRIASGIGQRMNEQADTKAHILISVNSIIISVFLSVVVRKIQASYLNLPIIIFLIVNLLTIVFSILATRPSVPEGLFNKNELEEKKVNLLFFGSFYRMNFDDYSKGMFQVLGDRHFLLLTLIRNLYNQGVVLGKKYRMLKAAYNIFMFGIIVSVISFLIASKYFI